MKHLSISTLLFLVLVLLLLTVLNASRLDTSPENHDNHDDNLLKPDGEGSIIRLPTETNLPQLNPTTSHVVVDLMNRRPVYHHNRFNKFPRRCHHHHHRSGSMDEGVELEIISSLKDYRRKHLRSNIPKYGYDHRRRGKVDDDTVEVKEEEYKGDDEWKGGRPYRHHHHDHDHDHDHDDHDHGHDHHDKYYKRPEIVKRIRKFLSHYLNW